MMVLITYDVNTETPAGQKRLRKVAKACQNFGQRVQNSVFECILDSARFVALQSQLEGIINKDKDSLRYYLLGNEWQNKVKHIGAKPTMNLEEPIIL